MKFGFIRTLHLIGIPLGHILQIGLTCFGLANIFNLSSSAILYENFMFPLLALSWMENDWFV